MMGVYQTASIDIIVPGDRVADLAKALREYEASDSNYRGGPLADTENDREYVGTLLPLAEGSEDYGTTYVDRVDGGVHISCGSYGKLSFDVDEIEQMYAAHGASGTITGEVEGEHYRARFLDGKVHRMPGIVVYPDDALHTFTGIFTRDLGFADDLPKRFNCVEAEALREIIEMIHGPGSGDPFIAEHARGDDDESDIHHDQYLASKPNEG